MKFPRICLASRALAVLALLIPWTIEAADEGLFDQKVRTLLAKRCVECHGEKKQKGELRLDAKTFAFKGGENGPVIVAGDSGKSSLFQRITSTDRDERMPPKGEPLSAEQIAAVKTWINGGAVWPENDADRAATVDKRLEHWAVQPVKVAPDGPASIDAFITAQIVEKGLAMSPEADRRTLIRRLSFDLLGLPPAPERVVQFVNDPDPKAYDKLVDEMLRSPHYGERWARHWLDIAHYADTHGFERDQLRPNAWRYRDYVIESLNADKPYDQFLREQIAGDVLAPNDPAAVTATGFLAAGPWDFVGQVETKSDALKRAARAGDLDDMVTQVMTASMGMTINCARCHDHKLDPITQEEYYRLWAVFAGVKRGDREVNAEQSARLREEKSRIEQQLAEVSAEIGKLAGEALDLADMVGGGDGRGTGQKGAGLVLNSGEFTTRKLTYHRDFLPNRFDAPNFNPGGKPAPPFVSGVFLPDGGAEGNLSAKIAGDIVLKNIPKTSMHSWDAVRNGLLNAQVHAKAGGVDFVSDGHSVLGLHANSAVTFNIAEIRRANGGGDWRFNATVGFGASAGAAASLADFAVYVDGDAKAEKRKMRKTDSASVDVPIPASARYLTLMATDGGDGIGSDLLFFGDARLRPELRVSELGQADRAKLDQLKSERARLQKAVAAVVEAPKVYAALPEAQPSVIRVQRRGNPEDPQQEVAPGTVAWAKHASNDLGSNETPEGARRAALARWITHPDNPLTRRVLVNRLWHHHFGQGIVGTPSDFGLGGDRPSHPALLDWLADEFLKSGWSLKQMHKLIVMSAAYRQTSIVARGNAAAAVDAGNRLLWRQNARRLDAESTRDAVLAVAGTLNPAMGGPGFRDFKYTEAYAPIYEYVTADKPELWRRSIYRFAVRTTPHQFLTTLDCPDPANFTPARAITTTALQALTLSNNEFMLQQAAHLSRRIENESLPDRETRIRRAFALAFQRPPTAGELPAATRLVAEQSLFALCRMLINANEFVYLD